MPPMRGCGSWPVVFIILALFFVSAVHSANVTAPSCKTKFNSTLKITVIQDPHRVRRADKPLGGNPGSDAPRCKASFNSTVQITEMSNGLPANGSVPKVGHIRRADKSPGGASLDFGHSGSEISDPPPPNSVARLGHIRRSEPDSGIESLEPSVGEASIDYHDYVDEGIEIARYLKSSDEEVTAELVSNHLLGQGDQLASRFTELQSLRDSGWNLRDETSNLMNNFNSFAAFGTALKSLKIFDKARPQGKQEATKYEHTLQWMDGSVPREPIGAQARFGFVTDPEDACLIITTAYSTQYWIDQFGLDLQNGAVSPPLSHQPDVAFLEWQRACEKHETDLKTLKHIFISVVTTKATQQIVDEIYAAKTGFQSRGWADFPAWNQRLTVEPDNDEYLALLASIQVKGIMWMLLQHREQLGKKTIKKISVFKDDVTGEPTYDELHRGPSIYLELEDIQSEGAQSGGTQSGGVKSGGVRSGSLESGGVKSGGMQSARLRRADNSPGGTSEESGSSQSDGSTESEGSNGRAPLPPLNAVHLAPYIRHCEVAAAYMRVSEETITSDLVRKGVYTSGQKLANPFTDHSAFKSNGWEGKNGLDYIQGQSFAWAVPFVNALQSLGISDKALPEGKHEHYSYDHTLPWMHNGQSMKPVGEDATFQYVTDAPDACIIMTMTYSTQHKTKEKGLTGFTNPPLSHSSDITFLDWKRACDKHKTDPKSLKHIFISVILTPTTQDIVVSILRNQGRPITDRADVWGNQLPTWEQKLTFLPDSDDGKALHATVQLKGIMWMLIQHREHLGKKAVKSISLFRGALPGAAGPDFETEVHGPTFYIELEDVA